MTAFILSTTYIYFILSIQYYRNEIKIRIESGYTVPKRYKAPFTIKKTVLLCILAAVINFLLYWLFFAEFLILINAVPVLVLLFVLRRYQKKIIKMDLKE